MGKVFQWNAQSMNAHGFEFYTKIIKSAISEDEKPSIICLQETWYDDYNIISFPDYTLITKNRKNRRGGLAFYIHKSVTFQVIKTPDDQEYQIIDIFMHNHIFSLVNFYNPCKKNCGTSARRNDIIL